MKNNRRIEELTERAKLITFPGNDSPFTSFKIALRELVGLNFGHNAQVTFGYDEYSRQFYWESDDRTLVKLRGSLVSMKRNFTLDPKKPIEEEFARIFKEYGEFIQACKDAAKALRTIGAEVH